MQQPAELTPAACCRGPALGGPPAPALPLATHRCPLRSSFLHPQVTFPLVLDLLEFCTPELAAQLKAPRLAAKEVEDRRVGLLRQEKKQKTEDGSAAGGASAAGTSADAAPTPAAAEADAEMADAGAGGADAAADPGAYAGQLTGARRLGLGWGMAWLGHASMPPTAASACPPACPSPPCSRSPPSHPTLTRPGKYELIGVLTHKGRSADSGHYVSWVKQVRA